MSQDRETTSMTQDALLTELCAICHLNRPRYKCPRCTIQTCSLPCIKRHKVWSECSGVRNPAKYRKRHELATPSSIDQDYNFITSVERSIERADDDNQKHGIVLDEGRRKRARGEARRDTEIKQAGAIVLKAPSGMSRALQNRSRWDNRHKCLLWTVEWVLEGGRKVFGNCQETRTIQEAYTNAVGNRKIRSGQSIVSKATIVAPDLAPESAGKAHGDADLASSALTGATLKTKPYFYLHRPNLSSNIRCVIPLQPDSTVKDSICGRVLNEFPTIFVLIDCKQKLQKPFITEEEYLQPNGAELLQAVSESLTKEHSADDHNKESNGLGSHTNLDEEQIRDVLQGDLVT